MQVSTRTWLRMPILWMSIFLLVVLAGCGGSAGDSTGSSASSSTDGSASMQTYKGDAFSISYPQDWTTDSSIGNGSMIFTQQDNSTQVGVVLRDITQGTDPATAIDSISQKLLQAGGYTEPQDHQMDATVQFGGTTWQQKAYDAKNSKGVEYTVVFLLATHQVGTDNKLFAVMETAPQDKFDDANTNTFQPMQKSFAFAS